MSTSKPSSAGAAIVLNARQRDALVSALEGRLAHDGENLHDLRDSPGAEQAELKTRIVAAFTALSDLDWPGAPLRDRYDVVLDDVAQQHVRAWRDELVATIPHCPDQQDEDVECVARLEEVLAQLPLVDGLEVC